MLLSTLILNGKTDGLTYGLTPTSPLAKAGATKTTFGASGAAVSSSLS